MTTPSNPSAVAHDAHHEPMGFWSKYVFSRDHKVIGKQFLFSGILFALLGGALAMIVRYKIAWPHAAVLGATRVGPRTARWTTSSTTCRSPCMRR